MIHRTRAVAPIHPSEDPGKIEVAIANVFTGATMNRQRFYVVADSTELNSLERIREAIRTGAESWRAYRRSLLENMHDDDDSTWFYLNKQAAYAGRVAICHEADESPLGPIKITTTTPDTGGFMDWLAAGLG